MAKKKFNVGDRVEITSECQSMGQCGVVLGYDDLISYYSSQKVKVRLESGDTKKYNEQSLRKINEGEGAKMPIGGKYRIARVMHVDGYNRNKEYDFALFDNDVVVGDFVLCDTQNGYNVAKVIRIDDVNENSPTVTKEIVCKVDFSAFFHRKDVRVQKATLKKKLDKAVAERKEIAFYEAVAKGDEEISELLNQYKALLEE